MFKNNWVFSSHQKPLQIKILGLLIWKWECAQSGRRRIAQTWEKISHQSELKCRSLVMDLGLLTPIWMAQRKHSSGLCVCAERDKTPWDAPMGRGQEAGNESGPRQAKKGPKTGILWLHFIPFTTKSQVWVFMEVTLGGEDGEEWESSQLLLEHQWCRWKEWTDSGPWDPNQPVLENQDILPQTLYHTLLTPWLPLRTWKNLVPG